MNDLKRELYRDGLQQAVKATGEVLTLLPRSINAALLPLHQWLLEREYNIEATKKLLEQKLQNVSPESIKPPEPYIAVPALQYISYCKDSEELRDMYANLLASAMNEVVRDGVHPGFVEIIKQLCPDEAKLLRRLSKWPVAPFVDVIAVGKNGFAMELVRKFSLIGEIAECEQPLEIGRYFDNLVRLGLLEIKSNVSLYGKHVYEETKEHPYIKERIQNHLKVGTDYSEIIYKEGYVQLTDFGMSFNKVCISPDNQLNTSTDNK